MSDLATAVGNVISCLAIKPGEAVVVLTDPPKRSLADAIAENARAVGAETILIEMSERETHGAALPESVAAAMLECDVFIAPTSKSASHTEARRRASAAGVRAATMPDVTEEMLIRTMSADYSKIARRSAAVAELLSAASEARMTSELGTDVVFDLTDRSGIPDDGDLSAAGAFGNLPAGEGFIAPVEGRTNGKIVFDGSLWPLGRLAEPILVEVVDGYAASFEGPRADEFKATLEPHGREAFAVAELGIGTNDSATLTGNVLEDEKILGTTHVAFGDNHTIGGVIEVPSHQDGIVFAPTLMIDRTRVITNGDFLL